ncbi:helix-turn-helix domain-containing protein [Micromonospora mangrovi]|uniref:Helix-turn-helix domain-containing protein n=2 Tax=Micromonospora TaxID=1873 RepID=A0AAU7MAA8_9ACTN
MEAVLAEAVVGLPDPRLRPYVDRYLGYRERVPHLLARREAAGAFVVLILGWGDPMDVVDHRHAGRGAYGVDSFVAGPFDAYCTTRTAGLGVGVQVLLSPPAARRVLGVPLGELTNRAVPADRVPGGAGRGRRDEGWLGRLRDRLAQAPDWPRRFALLDAALADRLADAVPVDPALAGAWRLLAGSRGRIGVAELAAEVGWSRGHLAGRFRRELGLPPKSVARLLRFQAAYASLGRELIAAPGVAPVHGDGWAELAVRCGYYDQSHLIREFREFTGESPTGLTVAGRHSSNPG